jgi:hypothetical protein
VISGPGWSTDLYGNLTGIGFSGSHLHDFTDAVGLGSGTYLPGTAFVTADVGSVPGVGVGAGVGITGLSASTISDGIYSAAVASFGQAGPKLKDTCDQLAATCVSQMALATLVSADTPVYLGVGTIVPGSIAVSGSLWGTAITAQGATFLGKEWPNFASAMGTGMAANIQSSGTGTLTIVGAAPPTPVPGTGAGTGTLS